MRVRRVEDDHVEIQMASLIDIVFLLLIFFLLTTTLKKPGKETPRELPLQLPYSAAAIENPKTEDLLILGVDKNGNKYADARPVTIALLQQRVRAAAHKNPNQRVRIDADRNTRYEAIIEVIELCQFEGLRNIGLHTASEQSGRISAPPMTRPLPPQGVWPNAP